MCITTLLLVFLSVAPPADAAMMSAQPVPARKIHGVFVDANISDEPSRTVTPKEPQQIAFNATHDDVSKYGGWRRKNSRKRRQTSGSFIFGRRRRKARRRTRRPPRPQVRRASKISEIKNSAFCRPAFPDLHLFADPIQGDKCVARHGAKEFTCPKGCVESGVRNPRCLVTGKRLPCNVRSAKCIEPFPRLSTSGYGKSCVGKKGSKHSWIPAMGCIGVTGAPHSADARRRKTACRVSAPGPVSPVAKWILIATNTHGAEASVETGMSNQRGKEITKQASMSFGVAVTAKAGFMGSGVEASASVEVSAAIGSSVASTISSNKVAAITVKCPDSTKSGQIDEYNPDSVDTEYMYQWVVGDSNLQAKTEHFRCHRVGDGVEQPPQCPPQFCGSPEENPYCKPSPAFGADRRCKR